MTEVWSVGRPHVWCEVRSLVSPQLSALALSSCWWLLLSSALRIGVVRWKVKVASSLTDVWQQLFEQQDIAVMCIIHFHPWLHDNHTSAPEPGETDWNRHAGTPLSEASEGRQWAEAACDWNLDSNQQGFVGQAIDQWRDCFNAGLKTKNKHFEHLLWCVSL